MFISTYLSPQYGSVVSSVVLKAVVALSCFLVVILESCSGKLLVYASNFALNGNRLQSVSVATEKIAKMLKLPMEVVTFGEEFTPIYVYYKNGDEEPIPVYCNKGVEANMLEIYEALRNIIFVLSFHPDHSVLKPIRNEVMLFS